MPIRQRGSKWQVDVAYEGLRRQRQAPDEVAAARMEEELLAELKQEAAGKASVNWTLETAVNKTRAVAWAGKASERSAMVNAKLMLEHFGKSTPLAEIDTDAVDTWITELEEDGNSGSTINRKLACLSKVFTVAIERGIKVVKPKLERRAEGEGRIRWITAEEEKTIISTLTQWGKADHVDYTVFCLDTGARPSEVFRLTSRDVDFTTGLISFWITKTKVSRSIPMTLRVRAIMERRCKDTVRPFPFSTFWYRNQWDRLKPLMGLTEDKQFVPYCLRHTFASRLVQRGAPIESVKELMGHKTIQMTLRYAHLAPANLAAAVALLDPPQEDKILRAQ